MTSIYSEDTDQAEENKDQTEDDIYQEDEIYQKDDNSNIENIVQKDNNTNLEDTILNDNINQKMDEEMVEDNSLVKEVEDEENDEEDDDDDSESDLEIIMDQTPQNKPNDNGTRNSLVNIKPNSYNKQAGPQRNESLQPVSLTSRTPGVDLNAIGTIDGASIYDVDLDSAEEKPWRKPGADITDYFNYGFNEYSWKAYCAKQKQMREDQHSRKKIHVFETKQEINLPPELQSIAQPQTSEHIRFQQQQQQHHHHHHHQQQQHQQHQHHHYQQQHQQSQQHQHQNQQLQQLQQQQQLQRGGRGRRGRDQDDSVIQVVSSEREAVLEEMDPIPPPMMDKPQNDEFGPPMAMGMFTEMGGGPIGHPPPFFMGNAEIPPSGPMGFDHNYRGGQPMRSMLHPTGIAGGLPNNMTGNISGNIPNMPGRMPTMPSSMPSGIPGMPRVISGMSGNITGNMVGRNERPFFSMEDQAWEIENRNASTFRPSTFPGRPPTGPMLGPGTNRNDFHEWERSPPPDAPFSHRMRNQFRPGALPTGPASHIASGESPVSERGDDERGSDKNDESQPSNNDKIHHGGYIRDLRGGHVRSREEERWDDPRKRTIGEAPRDDDEFRAKRRH